MHRDLVDVTVEVIGGAPEGGVAMFHATSEQLAGLDCWAYQRDDGAWLPVFPADAPALARPDRRGGIDLAAAVAEAFPELVR